MSDIDIMNKAKEIIKQEDMKRKTINHIKNFNEEFEDIMVIFCTKKDEVDFAWDEVDFAWHGDVKKIIRIIDGIKEKLEREDWI